MIPDIPRSVAMVLVLSVVAIALAIGFTLSSAARRSGLPRGARRRVRIGVAGFLGAWFGAVLFLAPAPASVLTRDPFAITPLMPLFLVLSGAAPLVALWRSPSLRRTLAAVPLSSLQALQSWRILGVVFVVLLALGQLPAHFALPAGWGDIAIGLTAPLVALAVAREARGAKRMALAWNVLGLLDLVVAVGMGTGLLAPVLLPGLGSRVPPAPAMGVFPMFLVPAFAVPASVLLHVISLGRLARERDVRPTLAPAIGPNRA